MANSDTQSEPLTLGRIALWYKGTKTADDAKEITNGIVRASVPILQRGLVWNPQQIEILWDSLLRGFPIGALVLCPKIKGQVKEFDDDSTHHILDGQQRCNAISLGFTDPFPDGFNDKDAKKDDVSSILWLDLDPKRTNSTREYLARLTTLAHPWGYGYSDNSDRLSASDIRTALKAIDRSQSVQGYKRPEVREMSPYCSKAPIPLAWLMTAPIKSEDAFWKHAKARLEKIRGVRWKPDKVHEDVKWTWAESALTFVGETQNLEDKRLIFDGICRARNATIIALVASMELMDETKLEADENGPQDRNNISNIEHLFQRLNRQGTKLDGEELAYSMIKAYWPELAKPIDETKPRHMPASRLVSLAVRAALAEDNKDNLPTAINVSQIRAKAKRKDSEILDFIKGREGNAEGSPLAKANEQVDKWLRYSADNPSGFLPVQITRFAMDSQDVYLLLLWLANRTMSDPDSQSKLSRPLQALASWIHWFANDKWKAVNCIYSQCKKSDSFDLATFRDAARIALKPDNQFLADIPTKDELANFMKFPGSNIDDWNWGELAKNGNGDIDPSRQQILGQSLIRIINNKELLVYAQREYLNDKFGDYDPTNKDMWQDYNCPWDYDHILAHFYVYNRKGQQFQRFIVSDL